MGSSIGLIKRDTSSLDYSSHKGKISANLQKFRGIVPLKSIEYGVSKAIFYLLKTTTGFSV